MYCIIPRSTISHSQPVSHLLADHVALNSLNFDNYELTNEYSLSSHHASLPNYRLEIDRLEVLVQSRLIMASKCISKLARSKPSSVSPNSHDYGLQVCRITATKSISKLAHVRPRRSHDHRLHTHSTTASECITQFTRSHCGATVEIEGRLPIINTPPHLAWHPKGILEKEWFWLEERRKRVRGYEGKPGHDEPHKLHRSMKAWQECVRPRAGKDRVCISYNAMMSIYPGVSQIYCPGC